MSLSHDFARDEQLVRYLLALLSEEDTPTRDLPWASIFSKPHFAA